MPAKFIEDDISHVLSADDFGVEEDSVVWGGVTIPNAIVDDMDVEVMVGEGVAEIIAQPMITGKTSDFPGIQNSDPIMIGTDSFRVKNFQRDGTGMIKIYLDRL